MTERSATIFLLNRRNKIFLIQRNDIPIWVMPGGHVEANETPEEAATRECKEETGYDVKIARLIAIFHRQERDHDRYYYYARTISGRPHLTPESRAFGWFSKNNLPKPMSLYEQSKIDLAYTNPSEPLHLADTVNYYREFWNQAKSLRFGFWVLYHLILNQLKGGSYKI